MGVLLHAASAITSGRADVVVAYRAIRARSGATRFGAAKTSTAPSSNHAGTTALQWCMPFGALTPASWLALNSTRYMHEHGVESADFGRAVVQLRAYAATNPAAWGYGNPITLDEHQASRWIVEPCIRLFDCCQETDGSVALVIARNDRAADLRQPPIAIAAATGAALFEQEIASDHYVADIARMESSTAIARRLFDESGFARGDLDVAMIYDAFTPILFMQLEALGFCGPGEAKDFVAEGNLGLDGALPCNTNGGLIGEGYIHGLNLVSEAARQLRRPYTAGARRPHRARHVQPDRSDPHQRLTTRPWHRPGTNGPVPGPNGFLASTPWRASTVARSSSVHCGPRASTRCSRSPTSGSPACCGAPRTQGCC